MASARSQLTAATNGELGIGGVLFKGRGAPTEVADSIHHPPRLLMHLTRWNVVLLAIAAGPASCASPTEPAVNATLVVETPTVLATTQESGPGTLLTFSVPLTIHNTGKSALIANTCDASIEEGTFGWSEAWRRRCIIAAGGGEPASIPPGGTLDLQVSVRALIYGPLGFIQEWHAPEGAPLRVRIGVGSNSRYDVLTSDTFRLREVP